MARGRRDFMLKIRTLLSHPAVTAILSSGRIVTSLKPAFVDSSLLTVSIVPLSDIVHATSISSTDPDSPLLNLADEYAMHITASSWTGDWCRTFPIPTSQRIIFPLSYPTMSCVASPAWFGIAHIHMQSPRSPLLKLDANVLTSDRLTMSYTLTTESLPGRAISCVDVFCGSSTAGQNPSPSAASWPATVHNWLSRNKTHNLLHAWRTDESEDKRHLSHSFLHHYRVILPPKLTVKEQDP